MAFPLVSIFVATYNQKDFIEETLGSAIFQDYENIEIIVADDASTDGTAEIIKKFADKYPGRVIPVLGEVNQGITANSNRGLALCRGKYIAFLGGDDIFLPGKIKAQVEWLEADEKRVLCYHDTEFFDSLSGKTLYRMSEKYRAHVGSAEKIVEFGCFFDAISVMIRRPEHDLIFDKRIKHASDWLYFFEIVEKSSGEIGCIDGLFARHRIGSSNITHNRTIIEDKLKTLYIIADEYAKYKKIALSKIPEAYLSESLRSLSRKKFKEFLFYVFKAIRHLNGNYYLVSRSVVRKIIFLRY